MNFLMRFVRRLILFLVLVFILPAALSFLVWQVDAGKPENWHSANWNTAGILPSPDADPEAAVYVMAARTRRWKGAFSVHSWIVTKRKGDSNYNRYDKVGWGTPIRMNAYAADANWYSNPPQIVKSVHGRKAAKLIPEIERAVDSYPHATRGNYLIWPGPNSNSFIAHVLNQVSELDLVLPANAIGRDYLSGGRYVNLDPDWSNLQVTYDGYLGFAIGKRSGFELHFLGLVAGIDILKLGLKLPGFGTIRI